MESIGLEVVIKDAAFAASLSRTLAGLDKLEGKLTGIARLTGGNLANSFRTTGAGLNTMGQGAKQAHGGFLSLSLSSGFLNVALGILARDAIRGVINGLQQLAKQAVDSVSNLERMELVLSTLAAREIQSMDSTLSMAQALDMAGERTQALIEWTQRLAVLGAGFTEEDVYKILRVGQVMGFTQGQAQHLADALVNFGSGAGLTSDELFSIADAMGVMNDRGYVLQLDLKRLRAANVNTSKVLRQLGFDFEDVTDRMVSSQDFIRELINTLDTEFAGAGRRAQGTMYGLIDSFQDLFKILARSILTPVWDQFSQPLQDFVDLIYMEWVPAAKQIGAILGQMTGWLMANSSSFATFFAVAGASVLGFMLIVYGLPAAFAAVLGSIALIQAAVLFLINPLNLLGLAFAVVAGLLVLSWDDAMYKIDAATEGTFKPMGETMFEYGRNIIVAFANGMAAGMVAVINALISIGQTIARMLSAHSPPKLLPHLADWGRAAINTYLDAWTQGDWSLLEDIADPIEAFLRSLPENVMGKTGVIPHILGTREAIRAAIEELKKVGTVSESTFQNIFKATGVVNAEMQAFIRSMIELEKANMRVAAAQAKLNAITEKYRKLFEPIDKELSEIEEKRQDFIDEQRKKELQAILNDPRAPAEAKMLALMELREIALKNERRELEKNMNTEEDAAQLELDRAEAEQARIEAQMEAQKAALAFQTENNRLMQEQVNLLKSLLEKLKAAKGGGEDGIPIPTGPPLSELIPGGGAFGEGMFADLQTQLEQLFDDVSKPFDKVIERLGVLENTWGTVFSRLYFFTQQAKPWIEDFGDTFTQWVADRGTDLHNFDQQWRQGLDDTLSRDSLRIQRWSEETGEKFHGWVEKRGQDIRDWVRTFSDQLASQLNVDALKISTWVENTGINFKNWVARTGTDIANWVLDTGFRFRTWVTDSTTSFNTWFRESVDGFNQWALDILNGIIQWNTDTSAELKAGLEQWAKDSLEQLTIIYDTITGKLGEAFQWIEDQYDRMVELGKSIPKAFIEGLGALTLELIAKAKQLAQDVIDAINWVLGNPHSPAPALIPVGKSIGQGLAQGMLDSTHTVLSAADRLGVAIGEGIIRGAERMSTQVNDVLSGLVCPTDPPEKLPPYPTYAGSVQPGPFTDPPWYQTGPDPLEYLPSMSHQQVSSNARNRPHMIRGFPEYGGSDRSSVSFGDTHIYSAMDEAAFEAKIRRVVAQTQRRY